MGNINWTVWLLAAAGGVVVGMIVLAVGMWLEARQERLDEEAEQSADVADGAATLGTALQALRPLPRRTPGASLKDDSGA